MEQLYRQRGQAAEGGLLLEVVQMSVDGRAKEQLWRTGDAMQEGVENEVESCREKE